MRRSNEIIGTYAFRRIIGTIVCLGCLCGIFSLVSPASAQTNWMNLGASNWFTPGNWSAGVPSSGVDAIVNNGGTPTIGIAGAAARNVFLGNTAAGTGNLIVQNAAGALTVTNTVDVGQNGTGVMTLKNNGAVSDVFGVIGDASGSNGTVTMNGTSSWTNSSSLEIGNSGTGVMTLAGSATVSNTVGFIGTMLGSTGSATVGGSAVWTNSSNLQVGGFGSGTLDVKGGGTVKDVQGVISGSSSSTSGATVEGTGSTWQNSSSLIVGDVGIGTLDIKTGGAVSNTDGSIGVTAGSTGTVTVNGNSGGATWTNSGNLTVGDDGSGTLNIRNGGTVSNVDGVIGNQAGSTGKVTVDGTGGASTWTNSGDLTVGNSGGGTLNIQAGGVVSDMGGNIATGSGSTGKVTVDGTGSKWTNSNNLFVGGDGAGTLSVTNGGAVSNVNGVLGTAGSGKVTVDGAGSTWTNSGYVYVGNTGSGTLNITTGGVVSNTDGFVGKAATGMGMVTVDGTGGASMWTNSGDLTVGDFGDGTMTIKNGGAVSNVNGFVGNQMGSTSSVTVKDAGSTWTNSQMLHIGDDGNGTLNIQNGGAVSNTFGFIGETSNGVGVVNVKGTGSTWTMSQMLFVGQNGNGTMDITNGGSVSSKVSFVGNDPGSIGLVEVDGMNSMWTATETDIAVDGMGTMNITNGGTVMSTFATVGSTNSSVGLVTVDGAGSNWTISGLDFTVGQHGSGTLQITNGGLVSDQDGFIGEFSDSPLAAVTVDGANSKWTNSGDLEVGDGGNGTLGITNGGAVSNVNGKIADASTSTASVTVDGAGSTWTNSGTLEVGIDGNATLNITNGGVVTVNGAFTRIAEQSDSTSSVTVDGTGSTWTLAGELDVARGGNGTMTIQNGGTVNMTGVNQRASIGVNMDSVGSATVDGAGSTWTINGALQVGEGGQGSMSITNGGAVSNTNAEIGDLTGAVGMVTVDGAGSTWTNSSSLSVGNAGDGTMHITSGGAVSNTSAEIGSDTDSTGLVTVDGMGSKWTNSGDITVGAAGNGTLMITAGGAVTGVNSIIARDAGSTGLVTVDGAGSTWTLSGSLIVGNKDMGTLNIKNGGTVSNTSGDIGSNVDVNFKGVGIVNVDGAGSKWTNSGSLIVGDDGDGHMHISNGGAVSNTFGEIGNDPGATGDVTVDGAGSTWTNSSDLEVGAHGGNGTMEITNGGAVSNTDAEIGHDSGSIGMVTVDGNGSTWTNSLDLEVGTSGTGTLLVTNGGAVSSNGGFIGFQTGSNGTATIDGAGSTWTDSANLVVGGDNMGPEGTGLLRIQNGGSVIVTGNLIVWNTGTLEIGASYTLDTGINIFSGGTLRALADTSFGNAELDGAGIVVDSNGFTLSLDGHFNGSGGLTKIGDGTAIITDTNTYTGDTNINAGTLQLDGSITSNTLVNSGGTLTGIGTIFGNLTNSGTVSPGHSPGTLTVNGNYIQNSGGNLVIEVASLSSHDLLQMGGTASLDGNLELVRLANFTVHAGDKVIFLTAAGGVNGEFATVNNGFPPTGTLLNAEVIYEPNDVALLFAQSSFVVSGLTRNQTSVAKELNEVAGDPRAADLIDFLDHEQIPDLAHDYDLIAPEELASIYEIGFSQAVVQNMNLQHRMDDIRAGSTGFCDNGYQLPQASSYSKETDGKVVLDNKNPVPAFVPSPENRWGVFVTGSGDFVNVGNNDDNAHGYDITTGDVMVGVDYRVCDHFAIGIDGAYDGSTADLVDRGRVEVDGGKAGAYATVFGYKILGSVIHLDGAVGGGWNSYDTHRTGLEDLPVLGSTNGSEFNAMLAYGGDWHFGCLLIGTWSSLQYTNVSIDGFTETGSLAPLHIEDQDEYSLRGTTGLRLAYDFKAGHAIIRPEVRAAWQHESGDTAYPIDARFASGAGDVFTVHGPAIGRDSALVDAGFAAQWNNRLAIYVYYDGVLGRSNYTNNAVSGGFRIGF